MQGLQPGSYTTVVPWLNALAERGAPRNPLTYDDIIATRAVERDFRGADEHHTMPGVSSLDPMQDTVFSMYAEELTDGLTTGVRVMSPFVPIANGVTSFSVSYGSMDRARFEMTAELIAPKTFGFQMRSVRYDLATWHIGTNSELLMETTPAGSFIVKAQMRQLIVAHWRTIMHRIAEVVMASALNIVSYYQRAAQDSSATQATQVFELTFLLNRDPSALPILYGLAERYYASVSARGATTPTWCLAPAGVIATHCTRVGTLTMSSGGFLVPATINGQSTNTYALHFSNPENMRLLMDTSTALFTLAHQVLQVPSRPNELVESQPLSGKMPIAEIYPWMRLADFVCDASVTPAQMTCALFDRDSATSVDFPLQRVCHEFADQLATSDAARQAMVQQLNAMDSAYAQTAYLRANTFLQAVSERIVRRAAEDYPRRPQPTSEDVQRIRARAQAQPQQSPVRAALEQQAQLLEAGIAMLPMEWEKRWREEAVQQFSAAPPLAANADLQVYLAVDNNTTPGDLRGRLIQLALWCAKNGGHYLAHLTNAFRAAVLTGRKALIDVFFTLALEKLALFPVVPTLVRPFMTFQAHSIVFGMTGATYDSTSMITPIGPALMTWGVDAAQQSKLTHIKQVWDVVMLDNMLTLVLPAVAAGSYIGGAGSQIIAPMQMKPKTAGAVTRNTFDAGSVIIVPMPVVVALGLRQGQMPMPLGVRLPSIVANAQSDNVGELGLCPFGVYVAHLLAPHSFSTRERLTGESLQMDASYGAVVFIGHSVQRTPAGELVASAPNSPLGSYSSETFCDFESGSLRASFNNARVVKVSKLVGA